MPPLVSVIVTVYKRTEFLEAALHSVLAQSQGHFEVLVADDSGTAAAHHIVAGVRGSNAIKYLPNPYTMGIVLSLKHALEFARGQLIAILNDDDLWDASFLAELVTPLQAQEACCVAFCDHWVMDGRGEVDYALSDTWSSAFGRLSLTGGNVVDAERFSVVQHGVPIANGAVFRRDAFEWALVAPDVGGAYDYWISCLLASTRRPMYYVPKRLTRYRVHAGMETLQLAGRHDLIYIYSTILANRWFPEFEQELRAELAAALYTTGRSEFLASNWTDARRDLWKAFKLSGRANALAGAVATLLPSQAAEFLRTMVQARRAQAAATRTTSAIDSMWRVFGQDSSESPHGTHHS
jgi:glycosyltransferase involved in cell wall biosynthesis